MTLSVLTTFQQWALFTLVVLTVGCVTWTLVVAPRAGRVVSALHLVGIRRLERKVASVGALFAWGLFAVWVLRGAVQLLTFRDPFVPLSEDVTFLLFDLFWGTVWMGQGLVVVLLVVSFLAARPALADGDDPGAVSGRVAVARWTSAVLALVLVASLAMSSHAMGVESWYPLAVIADGAHLLAAGAWIGSLTLIVTVGRGGGREFFAAQLRALSPMAILSVSVLLFMGGALTWTYLHQVSDLWTEPYGRVLSAKILVAGAVFLTGLWNWRRGLPQVDSEEGAAKVGRQAAFEVSIALGVLLLTAVLVHSPQP